MSLTPGYRFPDSPIKFSDLMVHIAMYGSWMFMLCVEGSKQYSPKNGRFEYMMLGFLIAFGSLLEVLQQHVVDGRYGSLSDGLANSFGAALALVVFRKIKANRDKSLL